MSCSAPSSPRTSPTDARPPQISNPHAACVSYLRTVYQYSGTGFGNDHVLPGACLEAGNLQYGEITYEGMKALYQALDFQEDDVFYDLGSGVGKLTLYVALKGEVKRSVGLEIGIKRHAVAEDACSRLLEELQSRRGNQSSNLICTWSNPCVLLADIRENTYQDATVTVLNNLCLDKAVESRVLENLTKCPSLRRIICVVQISPRPRFKLLRTVRVACTWAKVSVWHIYCMLPPLPLKAPSVVSAPSRSRFSAPRPKTPIIQRLASSLVPTQRPRMLGTSTTVEYFSAHGDDVMDEAGPQVVAPPMPQMVGPRPPIGGRRVKNLKMSFMHS